MADSPISHHDGSTEQGDAPSSAAPEAPVDPSASPEQTAQMEQAYAQMRRKLRMSQLDEEIKHKIMVLSGKGGVGKSTVSVGLALSLARSGKKVGLMDIDITGPNIPKMLGLESAELNVEDGQIFPVIGHTESRSSRWHSSSMTLTSQSSGVGPSNSEQSLNSSATSLGVNSTL